MVAFVLALILVGGAYAQFPAKPFFGKSASARATLPAASAATLPAQINTRRLNQLRHLALTELSVRVLPHGGIAIGADRRALPPLKAASLQDAASTARTIAERLLQNAGVLAPQLSVEQSWRDELGMTHVVLRQQIGGIPIWSSQIRVHYDASGMPTVAEGCGFSTDILPSLQDALGADGARRRVGTYLANRMRATVAPEQWTAERVIFPERTPPWQLRSCWHVTAYPDGLERWEVFVDTESGEIVFAYNNTHRDGPATAQATDLLGQQRTIHTYQVGGTYYLLDASRAMFNAARSQLPNNPVGAILTLTANNTDLDNITHITSATNTWNDPASVSAHVNAGIAYEYYRTTHSRNSLDGSGGTILSVVHVTQNGRPMDNAFWNGKVMAYGDGNIYFRPMARGLDVAAHEMTHGVIEHSANLVYLSQSGAINESMADVFAMMVDRDDWLVGEDVVNPAMFPSGAMRSFIDPHNGGSGPSSIGWQPKHMSEYQTLPETEEGDNGGVHVNSGIPNHACYLIAQQIGREKTERIYYRALTTYLTQNSQFLDLRRAVIRAAEDLYGSGTESQAAAAAFDAVGITDGGGGGTRPNDYQPVPGTDRLLVYRPGTGALYVFDNADAPTTPRQVSTASGIFSRPTVTDNGAVCIYVAADNTLRACALTAQTVQEQVIDPTPVWRSIAISPDGRRLAATSTAYDPMVYVFDLSATPVQSRAFRLYTPNYSGDTSSSQLLFADALQWHLDGQTLLLDALNATPTGTGDTLVYWDILQLRAWDNAAGTFGSGVVTRVLPVQPVGVSVGNPTFAKNSPYIIAFDRVDDLTGEYAIMAANLFTQQVEQITATDQIGYPSYRGDDGRIAFSAGASIGQVGIAAIGLDASKIRAAGSPQPLVTNAIVPVYFRVGQRPTSSVESSAPPLTATIAPVPATGDAATLVLASAPPQWSWTLCDTRGRCISSGTSSSDRATLPLDGLGSGMYYCIIRSGTQQVVLPLPVLH